ncbi:MAG: PAS domain S-box protein, partial [Thermodesulfobacteriota bacterium]
MATLTGIAIAILITLAALIAWRLGSRAGQLLAAGLLAVPPVAALLLDLPQGPAADTTVALGLAAVLGLVATLLLLHWQLRQLAAAKERLAASEAKYRELFEGAPDLYYTLDAQGRILDVNDTFVRALGRDKAEVVGRPIADFMTASSAEAFWTTFPHLSRERHYANLERELLRADGSVLPVILNVFAVLDEAGRLEKTRTIGRDMSARKRAEAERKVRESAIASAVSGIVFLDAGGRITYANAAAAALLAVPPATPPAGAALADWVQDRQELAGLLAHLDAQGSWVGELAMRRADGGSFAAHLVASLVRDEAGVPICRMASFIDVSERKRIEEERFRIEKLESVGVLAGGIAHDFNNLLTAILGNLSLGLRLAGADSGLQPLLADARQAALRARDLTRQLLTFARGGTPVRRRVAVAALLQEAAAFAVHGSNVRLRFRIASDLWAAEVDEGQISQVMHNLVINADQAMPDGGLVTVTADNCQLGADSGLSLPAGRYLRLTVADEGPGIPAEVLPRIFDPYFTTKEAGSGLGLATVHTIINRHGGRVSVSSQPGQGTVFSILLPACQAAPAPPPAEEAASYGR